MHTDSGTEPLLEWKLFPWMLSFPACLQTCNYLLGLIAPALGRFIAPHSCWMWALFLQRNQRQGEQTGDCWERAATRFAHMALRGDCCPLKYLPGHVWWGCESSRTKLPGITGWAGDAKSYCKGIRREVVSRRQPSPILRLAEALLSTQPICSFIELQHFSSAWSEFLLEIRLRRPIW